MSEPHVCAARSSATRAHHPKERMKRSKAHSVYSRVAATCRHDLLFAKMDTPLQEFHDALRLVRKEMVSVFDKAYLSMRDCSF